MNGTTIEKSSAMTGSDHLVSATDGHHGQQVPVIGHEGNGGVHDGISPGHPIPPAPIRAGLALPITRSGPTLHAKRRVRVQRGHDATRVVGYVRVSTEEQSASGAGLAAQREAITEEATRRGWDLLDIAEDAGYSGRDLKRPGITAVLELLRSKEAKD